MLRPLTALVLPWLTFLTIGKPIQAFVCLMLQLTLIGWIPAMMWAFYTSTKWDNVSR